MYLHLRNLELTQHNSKEHRGDRDRGLWRAGQVPHTSLLLQVRLFTTLSQGGQSHTLLPTHHPVSAAAVG